MFCRVGPRMQQTMINKKKKEARNREETEEDWGVGGGAAGGAKIHLLNTQRGREGETPQGNNPDRHFTGPKLFLIGTHTHTHAHTTCPCSSKCVRNRGNITVIVLRQAKRILFGWRRNDGGRWVSWRRSIEE